MKTTKKTVCKSKKRFKKKKILKFSHTISQKRKNVGKQPSIKKNKKKKFLKFSQAISKIKKNVIGKQPSTVGQAIKIALKSAKAMKEKMKPDRVVNIPKTGGILPLIPIFAGLSALGTMSGGAAAIAKAVNDAKSAKQQLEEAKRHNKSMEAIAVGKGLFLKPYKSGLGLFLHPANKKKI